MTMSQARYNREGARPAQPGSLSTRTSISLRGGPARSGSLARAMLAYIFIVEGVGKIAGYAGVAGYMQAHGVRRAAAAAGHSDRTRRRPAGALRLEDALGGDRAFRLLPSDGAVLPHRRRSGDSIAEECRDGRGLSRPGPARPRPMVGRRLARRLPLGAAGRARRAHGPIDFGHVFSHMACVSGFEPPDLHPVPDWRFERLALPRPWRAAYRKPSAALCWRPAF